VPRRKTQGPDDVFRTLPGLNLFHCTDSNCFQSLVIQPAGIVLAHASSIAYVYLLRN
jgi:hypothetical protein